MKTLALFVAYIVAATIIYVLPAMAIAAVFPCSYEDVVTFPFYAAIMVIMSLVGAVPVVEELDGQLK